MNFGMMNFFAECFAILSNLLFYIHKSSRQITENGTHMYQIIEYYTSSNKILLNYLTNEIKETKNDVWRYGRWLYKISYTILTQCFYFIWLK